jgi:Ulp1 family protease
MADQNTNLSKWIKIDIFKKDLLFIPVHQDSHWSLIIIKNPQNFKTNECLILYLDSLNLVRQEYY